MFHLSSTLHNKILQIDVLLSFPRSILLLWDPTYHYKLNGFGLFHSEIIYLYSTYYEIIDLTTITALHIWPWIYRLLHCSNSAYRISMDSICLASLYYHKRIWLPQILLFFWLWNEFYDNKVEFDSFVVCAFLWLCFYF